MDAELIRRYVEAVEHKRRLEADLRQLNELLEQLEPEVVDALADAGMQSIATPTHTVYLAEEIWARPADEERLTGVLDRAGLGDIARRRVNVQSLSAVVREALGSDGALPAWATEDLVTVTRRFRARVRAK